jgi:hypothetical protein
MAATGSNLREVGVGVTGLCECGCGEPAPVSQYTDRTYGYVRGEPRRFVRGHQRRGVRWATDPNPSGLCLCGCGGDVPLSSRLRFTGHCRFLPGHRARKSPVDYVEEDRGFESPCWVWQRKITGKGYGIVRLAGGREQQAHRWVWEREVGPLSADVELHHRCEVTACVRPSHCEPLTKEAHLALHWEARHAAR